MARSVPKSKPKLERNDAIAILKQCLGDKYNPNVVTLLGIRDYYLDSMGQPGVGDYNVYDGALIMVGPNDYHTFNFNTDPSSVTKNGRALARLYPGVYEFYRGLHKNSYKALRMYPEGVRIECSRDGELSTCANINLHKGGIGTWSEGCQTIPQAQYSSGADTFQPLLWRMMDELPHPLGNKTGSGQTAKLIQYVLIENKMVNGKAVMLFENDQVVDPKAKPPKAKPAKPKKKAPRKTAKPRTAKAKSTKAKTAPAAKATKTAKAKITKAKTAPAAKNTKTAKAKITQTVKTKKAAKTTKVSKAAVAAKSAKKAPPVFKINRRFFFDQVRSTLFHGSLKQAQVTGLTRILDEWEAKYDENDDRWLAYILATAHHETDARIEAIEEYGKGDGKKYGKPDPETGKVYYGRGLVQLTWKANYEALTKELGVDLVNNPELALVLDNAVRIMFYGMMNGTFGKKLSDCFKPGEYDPDEWRNARRTVNVLDKADLIAGYAKQYYAALSYMT